MDSNIADDEAYYNFLRGYSGPIQLFGNKTYYISRAFSIIYPITARPDAPDAEITLFYTLGGKLTIRENLGTVEIPIPKIEIWIGSLDGEADFETGMLTIENGKEVYASHLTINGREIDQFNVDGFYLVGDIYQGQEDF